MILLTIQPRYICCSVKLLPFFSNRLNFKKPRSRNSIKETAQLLVAASYIRARVNDFISLDKVILSE
jgi:hypothetical protein